MPRDFYVYDENVLRDAEITQYSALASGLDISLVVEPSLSPQARFLTTNPLVVFAFATPVMVDSVAVLATNAISTVVAFEGTSCTLRHDGSKVSVAMLPEPLLVRTMAYWLTGTPGTPTAVGGLYAGMKKGLPRNAARPITALGRMDLAQRTLGGHGYGMRRIPLKRYEYEFPWVSLDDKNTMETIAIANQAHVPHIINPYPEADDAFPPAYVTLYEPNLSFERRGNNPPTYTTRMEWQEAR